MVRHRESKLNFHVKTAGETNDVKKNKKTIRIFEKNNNCVIVEKMDDGSVKTVILTHQMFS